jgi:hypothetical protein
MQIGVARLCLDCDEVHDQERCPICASEAFVFLTRWVQPALSAKRTSATPPRSGAAEPSEKLGAYRQLVANKSYGSRTARFVRNGTVFFAVAGLARWGWHLIHQPTGKREA